MRSPVLPGLRVESIGALAITSSRVTVCIHRRELIPHIFQAERGILVWDWKTGDLVSVLWIR